MSKPSGGLAEARSLYVVHRESSSSSSSELDTSDAAEEVHKPGQLISEPAEERARSPAGEATADGGVRGGERGGAVPAAGINGWTAACGGSAWLAASRTTAAASTSQASRMQRRTVLAMGRPVPSGRGADANGRKTTRPSSRCATRSNCSSKARSSASRCRSSSMVTMYRTSAFGSADLSIRPGRDMTSWSTLSPDAHSQYPRLLSRRTTARHSERNSPRPMPSVSHSARTGAKEKPPKELKR
eukprot:scaffold2244_cov91-Isochrysis_galbana.AAC.5